MKKGVVLIWALVAVAVTTTIVGALGSYYTLIGRLARFYLNQTGSKFAAWRGLDESFHAYLAQLDDNSQANDIASAFFNNSLKTYSDTQGNEYETDLKVTKDGLSITKDQIIQKLNELSTDEKLTLEVTVTSKQITGGLLTKSLMREIIDIEKKSVKSHGLDTMPVFNYVYFANNYGHLDESIVANGEIGGNDKFTINGSRVNGYVNVRGAYSNDTSAVILRNSPKMWPYYYYMKRVVENDEVDFAVSVPGYNTSGIDYYTSVRPTNPIYISSTSNIVWEGGYEPPGINSKYGEIDSSGQFVNLPSNPYANEVAKYIGNNPYQDAYNYYYDGTTAKINPQHSEYLEYFDEDGHMIKHKYEDMYLAYYNEDGSEMSNPYSSCLTYYNENGSIKPFAELSELNSLKAEKEKYFRTDLTYESCMFKIGSPTTGRDAWRLNGSKRNRYNALVKSENEWTKAQNESKETYDLWKKWNTDKSSFVSTGQKAAYEEWKAKREAWIASPSGLAEYEDWNRRQKDAYNSYTQWNNDKTAASNNFTNWQRTFEDWLNNLKQGGEEIDLTYETAHLSISNNIRSSKRIINVTTNVVDVPNMSDGLKMQEILDHCKTNLSESGRIGGWLRCQNKYKNNSNVVTDIASTNLYKYHRDYYRTGYFATDKFRDIEPIEHISLIRTLSEIVVSGGDGSNINPFKNEDSIFSSTISLVRGSVILIGTEDYPIEIDGPVYFPGDVVIRGFVSGKGTIYAGRNIHIIGDITYLNPPNWPHKNMSASQNNPLTIAERNKACDLLMLVSRGCIVVGDYSSDIWQSDTNMKYLKSYGQSSSYCNDFCESEIGYTKSFSRDYTKNDGGKKVNAHINKTTQSGVSWMRVYNSNGNLTPYGFYGWTEDKYVLNVKIDNRKYYESIFGESVISGFKQSSTADPTESWKQSSSLRQRIRKILFGGQISTSTIEKSKSPIDSDITEINAALVANHGIFGVVGGNGMPQFTLNGAMICRDEGLLPSFTSRFNGYTLRKIWLNWDLRLKSSSPEGVLYGALMKDVDNVTIQKYEIKIRSLNVIQ